MKDQVKLPVLIVFVVAIVAVVIYMGSKAMGAGDLDQGQTKYTPGVPPWEDPLKKGAPPAGSPGAGQPVPPQPTNPGSTPPGGGPPGMTAPTLGNGN